MAATGQKLTKLPGYVFCNQCGDVHDATRLWSWVERDCTQKNYRSVFIYATVEEDYGED